jgi:hypothetical protein
MRRPPPECPVCGAAVPPRARACPGCGADERSGWDEEETRYDGTDLPDSAFEDEDDPAPRPAPLRRGLHPLWWLVAVGLLVLFILGVLGR